MIIAYIGKFYKLHDEEYIARSFELIGHKVYRLESRLSPFDLKEQLKKIRPDILLYAKWEVPNECVNTVLELQRNGMKTVCWLFDLYFDYHREYLVKAKSFFKSDYVFTTDGGHEHRWRELGINHYCVRQGIYERECVLYPVKDTFENDVIFIGSRNPVFPERNATLDKISKEYKFEWFGRINTDEVRGLKLNETFAENKIVIGDSYPSPFYWSNRIVETLGRGGFLIHREIEGLREEYPDLVIYNGTYSDLKDKIDYYLSHEEERLDIIKKNFNHVKHNYTMNKKCAELISKIK